MTTSVITSGPARALNRIGIPAPLFLGFVGLLLFTHPQAPYPFR